MKVSRLQGMFFLAPPIDRSPVTIGSFRFDDDDDDGFNNQSLDEIQCGSNNISGLFSAQRSRRQFEINVMKPARGQEEHTKMSE